MHELKGAIISGFHNLGVRPFDIFSFVGYAHLEEQRQFREDPGKPANLRIPVGCQNFSIGLTVAPNSVALEVRLLDPQARALCSLSRQDGSHILRFGKNEHVVDPYEAVQEFLTKAIGGEPRYDFLQEVH